MENIRDAALSEVMSLVDAEDGSQIPGTRMRLRAILDLMIVGLMVAILLTLSLPVCIAVFEQNDQTRRNERIQRCTL